MRSIPFATAVFASLAWCGCEEVVDLDGAEPAQVVIDARLQSGAAPLVGVSLVDGFGHPAASSDLLDTKASIRVSDGTVAPLALQSGTEALAYFSAEGLSVQPGLTYTLTLQTPGFAQLKSLTFVPPPVTLRTGPAVGDGIVIGDAGKVTIPFSLDGIVGQTNYYHLMLWIDESSDGEVPRPTAATLLPFQLLRGDRLVYAAGPTGYHFSEVAFGSTPGDRRLVVQTNLSSSLTAPTLYVELRTVSESYFQFFRNLREGSGAGNGVLPTAVPSVADNITGGSGLFGGFSSDVQTVALK